MHAGGCSFWATFLCFAYAALRAISAPLLEYVWVSVCVFANFISKIVLVPKYPLAQLRVLLYLLLLLLLLLVGLAGQSGTSSRVPAPGPRTDKQSASKCDDSRRRWATTIPKATEQKTLQSRSQSHTHLQSQAQSQLQYNFALIMYTKYAKYRNVCWVWL